MASHTQRTLQALRKRGLQAAVVERWVPYSGSDKTKRRSGGVRVDAFGFIDILAIDPERGAIIAVQSCAATGHAKRKAKILSECRTAAEQWLRCGGVIEIWSWRKSPQKRGSKRMVWKARIETITAQDLNGSTTTERTTTAS